MSTAQQTTPPTAPSNSPDSTEARERDERCTRGYTKHWALIDHEAWYDQIRDETSGEIRSKAEHELHDLAEELRKGTTLDSNARWSIARRIDLAQFVLTVCGHVAEAERSTLAKLFERHELHTPEELEAVRQESYADGQGYGEALGKAAFAYLRKTPAERAKEDKDAARFFAKEGAAFADEPPISEKPAPKSRRLKLVPKAPTSKRGPVSSKAVRRAS